jgi:hypothetical protein
MFFLKCAPNGILGVEGTLAYAIMMKLKSTKFEEI